MQNALYLRKEVSAVLCNVRERGQGLIEYALIMVLVALTVIAALLFFGPTIGNVFSNLNSRLQT
jgi:pilus assembly protein Flp/PilA